jgi:HlyD family secretion protein
MKITIPKILKSWFSGKHKKRNIWITVILAVVIILVLLISSKKGNAGAIQTGFVTKQNLQETVLSTGQVISGTDLSLSFQGTGVVRKVNVKEGDQVTEGQVLAYLNQGSAAAALTQAQANYDKLINGATQNDVQSLQDAESSAQVNLNNAYNGAFNTLNNGYTAILNAYTTSKTIQDAYFSSADSSWSPVHENVNNINNNLVIVKNGISYTNNADAISSAISSSANSLASVLASLQIIRDQTDTDSYKDRISAADKSALDSQKSAVSSALSSINSLQSSLALYKVSLQTAQHNLSAKQSPPRQEDIDSAQAQVDAARAVVNNLIITAPASGTITSVDVKVGELATPSKEAIVLQNVGDLHAEADVSEANVASLQVGQPIDYTFDALGPDQHFAGKVMTINPASTVISGVVNYLVKGSLENVPNIKPGMTANMTILVAKKDNALAVPSTAVINKNNKQYVRVIDNDKNKTYHEVQVQTGLQADGGLVEIVSGISDGQEIVVYMK